MVWNSFDLTEELVTDKKCAECKVVKDRSEFPTLEESTDGLNRYCNFCFGEMTGMKQCDNPKCLKWKPVNEFNNSNFSKDGLTNGCSECFRTRAKASDERKLKKIQEDNGCDCSVCGGRCSIDDVNVTKKCHPKCNSLVGKEYSMRKKLGQETKKCRQFVRNLFKLGYKFEEIKEFVSTRQFPMELDLISNEKEVPTPIVKDDQEIINRKYKKMVDSLEEFGYEAPSFEEILSDRSKQKKHKWTQTKLDKEPDVWTCYAIHNPLTNRVKFGSTGNFKKRFGQIIRMAGMNLDILGTKTFETKDEMESYELSIHDLYESERVSLFHRVLMRMTKSEYFEYNSDMEDFIAQKFDLYEFEDELEAVV